MSWYWQRNQQQNQTQTSFNWLISCYLIEKKRTKPIHIAQPLIYVIESLIRLRRDTFKTVARPTVSSKSEREKINFKITIQTAHQSSVKIDRQIWPFEYTCGWIGMFGPTNVTSVDERERKWEIIKSICNGMKYIEWMRLITRRIEWIFIIKFK